MSTEVIYLDKMAINLSDSRPPQPVAMIRLSLFDCVNLLADGLIILCSSLSQFYLFLSVIFDMINFFRHENGYDFLFYFISARYNLYSLS